MIDIHSHVLPAVDDGAVDVEMGLAMLDLACRDGTDAIILTPHYAPVVGYDNPREKIEDLFGQFHRIVREAGIPIDLFLGCEYLMESADRFRREWQTIRTLNDTDYLLMEFFFEVPETEILRGIDAVLDKGLTPIIAHPERYDCVKLFPGFGEEMVRRGAFLQMNKGSPLGAFGRHSREAAMELMDRHLYSLVGSDAHRPAGRDPRMSETYDYLCRCFGRRYCDRIFMENPDQLLRNEPFHTRGEYPHEEI